MKKSAICLFPIVLNLVFISSSVRAQQVASSELPDAPASQQSATDSAQGQPANPPEEQRKGFMRILPNYESPSASVRLPAMSPGQKLKMATRDSFSPSLILLRATIAGIDQARGATPEFHTGAPAYARYFWHSYADAAIETMLVEGVMASATREDPRYYRLGTGGFGKRVGYAVTRVVVTRTDAGRGMFNVSEIVGASGAAGISDLYYPKSDRTFGNAAETGGLNIALDAATFVVKEFWSDVFHGSSNKPAATH